MVCNYKYPIIQSINPILHQKSVVLGGVGENTIYMAIALRYMEIAL